LALHPKLREDRYFGCRMVTLGAEAIICTKL